MKKSLFCALSFIAFSLQAAPQLLIYQNNTLLRNPVGIVLQGAETEEQIQFELTTSDELKRKWSSSATFVVDNDGKIDLSKEAPLSGSYSSIDPMGLFWSMNLDEKEMNRRVFSHPSTDPIVFRLHVTRSQGGSFDATITRLVMDPTIRKVNVGTKEFSANLFLPKGEGPFPVVIVLGSLGGLPPDAFVSQFANEGFAALGCAFYKGTGLPDYFSNVPIEYFKPVIDWIKTRSDLNGDQIAIVGEGLGGQAALLIASLYPDIKAVATLMSSCVLFQSLDSSAYRQGPTAPFTWDGKPLPFIAFDETLSLNSNANILYLLRLISTSLFKQTRTAIENATIHLETIQGPILMLSGLDDEVLPSAYLSGLGYNRLNLAKFPFPYDLVIYAGAGHVLGSFGLPYTPTGGSLGISGLFNVAFPLGGTRELNAVAEIDSWNRLFTFLNDAFTKTK